MRCSLHYIFLLSLIVLSNCQQATPNEDQILAVENGLKALEPAPGTEDNLYTIEERMQYYKVPGASVAVIDKGKLAWAKGYGIANTQTGSLVNTETLFQAASISKPLAAMGALALVDQGLLELDEDVNEKLKTWKIPENAFTVDEKVSLRRLLTHTAGLTVHGFPGYPAGRTLPDTKAVLLGQGNTPTVEADTLPGSLWRYSGGGYTVVQQLLEDETGLAVEDYLENTVLKPLGMEHSTYINPLPETMHDQASAAYNKSGELIEGFWHNYPEKTAAGLWTTPTDLALYLMSVQKAVAGAKHPVLSSTMIEAMLQPDQNNWGLGPALTGEGALIKFGHGGKNEGYTNHMTAYIHEGKGIVVMTSADNGLGLIREIMRTVSRVYKWPE